MKRDKHGRFTRTWEAEAKQSLRLSLTQTAKQRLEQQARSVGMSCSELVERFARNLPVGAAATSQSSLLGEWIGAAPDTEDGTDALVTWPETAMLQEGQSWQPTTRQPRQPDLPQAMEERLSLILQATNDAVYDRNLKTGTVWWNEAYEELFGPRPAEQVAPQWWAERLHPEDREAVLTSFKEMLAGDQDRWRAEYRYLRADGSYAHVVDRTYIVRDAAGVPERYLGAILDVTHLKQMERSLLEANQKVVEILESITDAFIAYDREWRVSYINQKAEQGFGQPRQAILGQCIWDLVPQAVGSPMYQEFHRAMAEQVPVTLEIQSFAQTDDWIEINAFPSSDGLAVYWHEISERVRLEAERKRAEAALAESTRTLQAIVQACPLAIIGFSAEGIVQLWNPAAERIFGWQQAEVLGQVFPAISPEQQASFLTNLTTVLNGNPISGMEARRQKKSGEEIQVALWAAPIDDPQAQIRCLSVVADITERKQAEAALRQSEERYRYLAELIPQLVWTADGRGALLDINLRWSTYTGLTLEQARTEGWAAVVHPEDAPVLGANWTVSQQLGTPYQAEGRMRRADGVYRWHLHQAVPLRDDQNQIVKWFGTATDIEDQKQLEQERDRILQQEQAARHEAEAANRIKDEFLAVLSHELRSPLNPILGWTRLLRTRKFDAQATDRALETIERNVKLQAQLIEDLLDVSRILRGKLVLNVGPVDLADVVDSALETVRLSVEAKQIQIKQEITASNCQVAGDAARLQQVVWNLLSNAVKFTPTAGQITLRLTQDGTSARIQVEDTGKGIKPDFLPHIFDSFRQEDGSITRQFGGLGLGLAIVRHLVELHGGQVWADSQGEDQGAVFTVSLPLMLRFSLADPTPQPTPASANLRGVRVLVVDDEIDSRDLVSLLLTAEGASVVTVSSAHDALNQLANQPFDILISDIGMPEVDGYALVQTLRQLPPEQGGAIPAIALTAYAGEINQRRAQKAGFQTHLAKPVEPQDLVQAIIALVPARQPGDV